jgi:heme-degrading monooxygenase HmoA
MFARTSTFEDSPDQIDEALLNAREQVLPLLQRQGGFKGFIALADRQAGKAIRMSLWESEQAMQASEEAGDRTRSETAQVGGGTVVSVERYEVALLEVSS